jgi:hypothetical protein
MRHPGRLWVRRVLQAVILGAVLWFAGRSLADQWSGVKGYAAQLRPDWPAVLGSTLLVLATYGLLIESWRVLVRAGGDRLAYRDAVRIWAVSNLGRYLPGKLWSIGALSVLSRDVGVSPAVAAGSAVIGTLVNIAAGFVVLSLVGGEVLGAMFPRLARVAPHLPVVGLLGLVAVPVALPWAARLVGRVTGRAPARLHVPARVALVVIGANVAAWLLYGVAFRWLAGALRPDLAGKWQLYSAVFAGSYLAGYLALVVPGGLGVREVSMAAALVRAGGADPAAATVLALASRLWLTVLELLPGLVFVARGALRTGHRSSPDVTP